MHEDIRKQLLNQGVKESPAVYVYRLYEEYKDLEAKGKVTKSDRARMGILERAKKLYDKINSICSTRNVGNPFKGQPIEAIDNKRK
jgi:hypothetical protein